MTAEARTGPSEGDAGLDAALASASRALDEGRPADALAVLDPVLAADPDSIAPLTSSIAAARMTGDIARAQALADRLAALMANNLVSNATARALAGRPLGFQPAGLDRVVPVLLIDDALPATARDAIWAEAFGRIDRFTEATVIDGGGRYSDGAVRSSRLIETADGAALAAVDRVRAELDRAMAAFGLAARPDGRTEVQVTLHGDGDFFRCHQDRPNDRVAAIDGRRISFVYYMCRTPRRFSGGELRIYDWMFGGVGYRQERWTLVEPQDNRLIVFPSDAYHEVLPLALDSADPQDGRLTVNGWLHVA